jgi:hypothetical protein
MRSVVKSALVAAGASAFVLGGSVYAFADWSVEAKPSVITIKTEDMPAGIAPSVAKAGRKAKIEWVGSKIAPGVRMQSYVVTRFGTGAPVVVCERVTATSCTDSQVPGGTWTWRVQPVFETWVGDYSGDSARLTFSGPPPAAATLVRASPTDPAVAPGTPAGARAAEGISGAGDAGKAKSPPAPEVTTSPPGATGPGPVEPPAPPPAPPESSQVDPTPPDDQPGE